MQDTEETNRQAKRKAAIEYGMQRRAPALSAEILTGVANSSSPPSPV
ncbi:unnamed protein product [Penicillium roqueforti FM164]|uniref:Genomic scaffold, ProqFM164S03 n=1 Tax=Penicillium roqueforti (strain FM164) TaxID=1365484 RepID=W6QJ03_PENRF|nr:unnamed protein product [Penicillium roqueforti FM164]